jgi:4-amino-4-deoxy-L-arabinose transferase-like glycosyltransferase
MVYLKNISKRLVYFKRHTQLVIIILGVLVRLRLLFTPLSFSTDAWRQTDTASIAYHFHLNGYKLFYPQIFWGGNGPGYVETEFQLYPFLVSILYYFFGENYWLGKFVSLLFSVFAWLLFYLLAKKVLKERQSTIWALFFLVFSPLSLRYSVAFMPEATVMFFYIASLFFFVDWVETSNKRPLVLASACSAIAILVKPTSVHIGLIFALLALDKWGVNILRRWETWLSIAIALTPGILWYLHARNIYLTYGNTFGLLSGGDSKFGTLLSKLSPHLYYHIAYLELKWILGFGAIFLFCAGAVIATRRKALRLIIFGLATIGLYYLIVSRYAQQEWGIQYHVYMLPFAALTVGLGVTWTIQKYKGFARNGLVWLSTGVFLGATLILFFQMLFAGPDDLYACASYVKELVPSNKRIIVSTASEAFDNGIPNNYQEPDIFFYSRRYGWSLPAEWHTPEKLMEYRSLGAAYFVIYSKDLLENNPALRDYLDTNSLQVGPGIASGCAIYRFLPPTD